MATDSNIARTERTIKESEFKARCLKLKDEVAESGEEIVITKNGKPVSKLTPYRQRPKLLFGRNRDNIRILGDIVSSTPAEWYDHDGERGDLF